MLVTLIQWLKTHYQPVVLQERQLTEEQLQPLADMAKALMGLFANQHLLEKDEISFVIEGLLIIAECYVAQCYNRLSTEQQLKFLIKEVQPTLTILAEKQLLTLAQQQDFEARIATFQADVLAQQQANWRNGSAIEEVLPYAQKLVQLEGYTRGLASAHTQAERKLNQLEANFLFEKASFYVEQRLAGPSLSATQRLGFENAAEQLGQLLQLAHLKAKALCWYSQLLAIAINQQWPNWRIYLNRFAQVTTQQMPQATALWRYYQQLLTQYRHTLQQLLVVQPAPPALAQFNTQLIQLTQQLWQESEQLLGPSPVKYCVLALGSMSQNMLSAYSDVEYALLTETAEAADWEEQGKVVGTAAHYIKTLCEVFEFKVVSLGESNTGYQLDPNSQPRTEPSLRGTPNQLVERCLALEIESHDGLVYSLLHATPLQGDQNLFKTFQVQLHQAITQPCTKADHGYLALTKAVPLTWHQYWALAQFKRNKKEYDKYCVDKKETPDLKKPYLKLLRFMVLDLALYLNLPAQDFSQACEQLVAGGYLPTDIIETLKEQVNYLLVERNKLHLARGKEDDSALAEHQVRLEQIQQTLLAPYFNTIHILETQGYALWQQAFWLACVPHHLSRQRTTVALTLLEAGFDREKLYLPPELLQKVFAGNGQIKATTPERNSAVFEWGPYCLKIQLPDAPKLEAQEQALQVFIAREYVVNQLSRALGWLVTPAGCAIKLQFEIKPGQTVLYYGWLSQRLTGRDLENAKRQQPALLKSISSEDYTALFLLSLLIYPEDGQPRNFMIVNNTLHQPAKLYSLDNKRVFVDPIEVVTSGLFRKTTQHLKLKTCLYFLATFKAVLNKKIWQQCQQLDLAKVRKNLLSAVQAFDRIVIQTLTAKKSSGQLVEHEFRGLLIPPYVLYSFLFKLEQLLAHIPNANHLPTAAVCLKQCEPEIYKLYEKHLVSTVDYYQTFKANYRSNQFGQNFSKATLDFIHDNKIKAKALGQQLLKVYPKFAISISWKDLPAEQQYHLLQLLQGQSLFELDLSDCVMLKNENLEEILKASPQLKLLNISNCPHLSPIVFKWVSRYCKQLETLIVDNNFWLKHLEWTADLNNLTTLSLKECNYLEKLDIKNAKKLIYFYIPNTLNSKVKNAQFYADAFNARATEKLINQKYQDAIEDLDYAIRLYPTDDAYYFNRGSAKINLKEYQAAAEDWYLASELFAKSLDELFPGISNLLFDGKKQILEYISKEGEWPEDVKQLMHEAYSLATSETASDYLKGRNYFIKSLINLMKKRSFLNLNNSTITLLQNNLGWMWAHGLGCRKNLDKAFALYNLAVNSNERAKFNMAFMYANGWGCELSENKALEYLENINQTLVDLLSGTFTVEELKFLVKYSKKIPRWLSEYEANISNISEMLIKFSPNNAPLWSTLNETYSSTLIVNTEKLNSPAFPIGAPLHFSKTYVYLYTLVINQNPDDTIALLYRAYSNLNLNNYQAVLDDVEELIRLNSELKSDVYFLEGYALSRLEHTEKAIASYKKAVKFEPSAVLYNNIAFELASLGLYAEAIENCNCAIKLGANLFIAIYNRGVFNFYLGNYKDAIDDLTDYINLDSDFGRAFAFRGFAKYKLDLLQEAIDDFELGVEGNDALAAILLGFLHTRGVKIAPKIESLDLFFQQLKIKPHSASNVKVSSKSFLYYLDVQAEKFNSMDAQILLGIIYKFGLLDINENAPLALSFFRKAALQGDNYAKEFVQKILDQGLVPKAEIKQISQLKPVSKDKEIAPSLPINHPFIFDHPKNKIIPSPAYQTTNSVELVFEVKSVVGDGDCGYTAFGITRNEAHNLLKGHLATIRNIIKPALQEVLRTQVFIDWLQNHGHLTQALAQAYANYLHASNLGGDMPQSILDKLDSAGEDLTILLAYIEYDVSAKQIDHGWSHPCILFALAEIQNIELHIWQYDEQDKLVQHRQYPYHIPTQVTQRTDLLFVNGNHFERLEPIDKLNSSAQLSNSNTLKL